MVAITPTLAQQLRAAIQANNVAIVAQQQQQAAAAQAAKSKADQEAAQLQADKEESLKLRRIALLAAVGLGVFSTIRDVL